MSECGLPSPHITSITVDFDVGQRVHPDTHPVGHCLEVETVLTGHSCLNRVALFYIYVMLRICYLIYALCYVYMRNNPLPTYICTMYILKHVYY